ncbi:class I SAM-dependent methyltransferase [Pelagicoccus mobilis]|uniref:Class I SAM-dependent methyltransferase n=1 Tax=Pelagicoccus mobilis TaxID=415221 RepID=A0A934VRY0_9BACT|nr:class I SAM-dependent methyltransferase [Pelagicoccus mobilis]MBK1877954.1 class I SAM-dependent methyltransferase [Pelagicoccus mobilis]
MKGLTLNTITPLEGTTESSIFQERCNDAQCRGCGHVGLLPVLDLGMMPPSDRILRKDQLDEEERRFPLDVGFCPECSLMQILETVSPEFLFGPDYMYFSSFSPAWLEHCRGNALDLIESRKLDESSLVVELASNDGYLLKNFVEKGVPVLGIDPAPRQAAAAEKIGVPTLNTFFSSEVAEKLKSEGKQADVIIGNNVLAHVADTHGFVEGIHTLLKPDGVVAIEAPYARDLVDHCEFDTIYHEHLCYFSLTSVDQLMRRHGLYLNHAKRLPTHGGSVRYYIEKVENPSSDLKRLLKEEQDLGMTQIDYYRDFARRVQSIREDLYRTVTELREEGKRVAAYGAAAKGTIMLNSAGLDVSTIDYVVDRNTHKHGWLMPGVHVEILPVEKLLEDQPDYVVLLPWNFSKEILDQQSEYRKRGGKFIIPVPEVHIV